MSPALILIVEDDAAVRSFLGRLLSRAGYRVVAAESGEEGLRLCERSRPDLVVIDARLPGIDGFAVCRLQREGTDGGGSPSCSAPATSG